MFRQLFALWTAALLLALTNAAQAESKVEWKSVKQAEGVIVETTVTNAAGNGRNRAVVRPVRVDFAVNAPVWRVTWATEATQERLSRMRVILYKEDTRGRETRWRKAGTIGTMRGSDKGEKTLTLGEGKYYLEITGSHIKYNFTVEEAHRTGGSDE